MKLDRIRNLLYSLEDIEASIEDLEMYAVLIIEEDLSVNADFTFYRKGGSRIARQEQPEFEGFQMFFSSTATYSPTEKNDTWSMVRILDQSMMLKMMGLMQDDLLKKKKSIIAELKRLGIDEGATDTIKKD